MCPIRSSQEKWRRLDRRTRGAARRKGGAKGGGREGGKKAALQAKEATARGLRVHASPDSAEGSLDDCIAAPLQKFKQISDLHLLEKGP